MSRAYFFSRKSRTVTSLELGSRSRFYRTQGKGGKSEIVCGVIGAKSTNVVISEGKIMSGDW
jgi:hypothetical protein